MKNAIYFPGLNALRFLAALAVVFGHIGNTMRWFDVSPGFFIEDIFMGATDAVTLFFVLSGFLITYLLLAEIQRSGRVDVKKFYIRRILRIWPLYYLIIIIGFFGLPLLESLIHSPGYYSLNDSAPAQNAIKLVEYLFILPHVGAYFGSYVTGIGQLWSIGIEENFYLIWPVLALLFRKHMLRILLGIIIVKVFILLLLQIVTQSAVPMWLQHVLGLLAFFRVENMAVGGLGAYILFTKQEALLRIIFHPVVEKGALILMIFNAFGMRIGENLVLMLPLTVLYVVFIMNISCNPRSTLKLEHRLFNSLGQISYGIYMYHVPIIYVVILLIYRLPGMQNIGFAMNLFLYCAITLLTIGVAYLSYHRFEMPFLRLKEHFSVVKSGYAKLERVRNMSVPHLQ